MPILQRLEIVHPAAAQLIGAGREQPVGRALEEQKRRPRLELRVLLEQLAVSILQCAEVVLFLLGELVEDLLAALVLGDARRARIELQPAALGGNRDAKRVAREQQLGGRALLGGGRPVRQASHVP